MHSSVRSVILPAPPVGADWIFEPSSGGAARVEALTATFSASATAANRIVHLLVLDTSGAIVVDIVPEATITAGLDVTFSGCDLYGASTIPAGGFDGVEFLPLPALWLPPGWTLSTRTTALQAGDAWSAVVAMVRDGASLHAIESRELRLERALMAIQDAG